MLSEGAVKIGGIIKAAPQRDFQNIILVILVHKQEYGTLNSLGNNVAPKRNLEEILEQGRQIRRRNVNSLCNIRQGKGLCQMHIDIVNSVTNGVDIFTLESAGLSNKVVVPNQGNQENVQIGFHQKCRLLRLRLQFFFDFQQGILQGLRFFCRDPVLKLVAVGKAKINALVAQTVKGGAKQIGRLKMDRQ